MNKATMILSRAALVLLLLITPLLLVSCSKPSAMERLNAHILSVKDIERSAQLTEIAGRLEQAVGALQSDTQDFNERLTKLNADYNVTSAQISQALKAYDSTRAAHQADILSILLEMKAASTPEEWAKLSDIHIDLLRETFEKIQASGKGA